MESTRNLTETVYNVINLAKASESLRPMGDRYPVVKPSRKL